MNQSSGFSLLFGKAGDNYQVVSVHGTERVMTALQEMGIEKGTNVSLLKITDDQEAIIQLNYSQITLTPKLINAIKVIESVGLQHRQCGNCGKGCGR